jgi:hypothetical protein
LNFEKQKCLTTPTPKPSLNLIIKLIKKILYGLLDGLLDLENATDMLSWNSRNKVPFYAASIARRANSLSYIKLT